MENTTPPTLPCSTHIRENKILPPGGSPSARPGKPLGQGSHCDALGHSSLRQLRLPLGNQKTSQFAVSVLVPAALEHSLSPFTWEVGICPSAWLASRTVGSQEGS